MDEKVLTLEDKLDRLLASAKKKKNVLDQKELLDMWMSETEGAKFWLSVVTELQNRGVNDILIACIDGLKGFP